MSEIILSSYTKKIIRRLSITVAVLGGFSVMLCLLTSDFVFGFAGVLSFVMAFTGYDVGRDIGGEQL